jgi:hypothetical protein
MNQYVFLYRNPPNANRQRSPAEMQEMFAQWNAWKTKFKENIINVGDGLKPTGKLLSAGKLTDAPFTEAKEIIGGYSIVQAESYEKAAAVASECPVVHMPGAVIEIREVMNY